MSSLISEHREQLTHFQSLFQSYTGAHGTFQITATNAETGKKNGMAKTISRGAPLLAWEEHLAGGPKGLGAICALAQKTIPSVIAGASNDDQLEQNLEAVGWTLTADDLVEIERLSTD